MAGVWSKRPAGCAGSDPREPRASTAGHQLHIHFLVALHVEDGCLGDSHTGPDKREGSGRLVVIWILRSNIDFYHVPVVSSALGQKKRNFLLFMWLIFRIILFFAVYLFLIVLGPFSGCCEWGMCFRVLRVRKLQHVGSVVETPGL